MKLWTIQDELAWEELQTKGTFIQQEKYIDIDHKEGYDWMRDQMNKRIGPPTNANQYPIWGWYQATDVSKKKPDLRESGYLPRGTVGYRIEIEKDTKDVLLSDFELWHTPLCYRKYIANSEEESIAFEKEFGNTDLKELSQLIKDKIKISWEKVFDMDFDVPYFALPFEEKIIQATFWELKLKDIIKVDKFTAR